MACKGNEQENTCLHRVEDLLLGLRSTESVALAQTVESTHTDIVRKAENDEEISN